MRSISLSDKSKKSWRRDGNGTAVSIKLLIYLNVDMELIPGAAAEKKELIARLSDARSSRSLFTGAITLNVW